VLITYRGREYQTTSVDDAQKLAAELGIFEVVTGLQWQQDGQHRIDRALWEAILDRVGKGVLAEHQAGAVSR
jgi:hypothetical protein